MLEAANQVSFHLILTLAFLNFNLQDIPSKFSKLSDRWDRLDYITVYEGKRCWKLQVRARRHGNRMCIHDGWIKFRSDMRLAVGDAVKFIWQSESIRNFDVLVLKKVQNAD